LITCFPDYRHVYLFGDICDQIRKFSLGLSTNAGGIILYITFYPRDGMLARVFARATCQSVRLSVCLSVPPSHACVRLTDYRYTSICCMSYCKT